MLSVLTDHIKLILKQFRVINCLTKKFEKIGSLHNRAKLLPVKTYLLPERTFFDNEISVKRKRKVQLVIVTIGLLSLFMLQGVIAKNSPQNLQNRDFLAIQNKLYFLTPNRTFSKTSPIVTNTHKT